MSIPSSEYGCGHYKRKCKLVAPCCGDIVSCRVCHDEVHDSTKVKIETVHKLDRFKVMKVICTVCSTENEVVSSCSNCSTVFGNYFCPICRLYDDDTSKGQFHCDKCGICRVGGRENIMHCDACGFCVPRGHKCNNAEGKGDNKLNQNCPICYEYLFDSRSPATFSICGHAIHDACLSESLKHHIYKCPVCNKSLVDMTEYYTMLDEEIAHTPLPDEYKDKTVTIICNDCNKTSTVSWHFIAMKCLECGSYNTATK